MVRKSRRTRCPLNGSPFSEENPLLVQERGSVFVLGQAIKQEHPDSDQELCRNDGIWPFAITVNCHPKFVSGSGPEEPRTWTRSVEEPFFSKDGSMLFDEGRLFAASNGFLLLSVQRFLGSRC